MINNRRDQHEHHNHQNDSPTNLQIIARHKSERLSTECNRVQSCNITGNRLLLFSLALLAILTTVPSRIDAADSVNTVLRKMKIADIISAPSYLDQIKVDLNNNNVKPEDNVPAKHFKDLKNDRISWPNGGPDVRYTILLLDLDRRSSAQPNKTTIYNQFLSINLPGDQINLGQAIVAFEPPIIPCSPSSKHRILMLALQQDQHIDIASVASMAASSGSSEKVREGFDIKGFIERHRLTIVAANAFYAVGEASGLCSGASLLATPMSSLLMAIIAMVTTLTLIMPTKSSIRG